MKRPTICAAFAVSAFALSACSGNNTAHSAPTLGPTGAPMSNGQAIFQTGRDLTGHQISSVPPPMRPSCAACHNANGSGGVHLPGGAVSADLRYDALVNGQKTPYTLALLQRAITTGIDNQGQKLSPVMPRWKMSPKDLHDVAQYVLTLH
ncbi:MAG TPA: c-type cytochrome [Candidatus Baltobacteraceae bacterium]|nr:c-type cytochrome [Candidatus Baltobacteraceae bacterium]